MIVEMCGYFYELKCFRLDLECRHTYFLYADQCPWHEKSVEAIKKVCAENDVKIEVQKINSAEEAQQSPSGFGVFALIHDGKLLEDHYLSETRFRNILGKIKN